MMFVTLFFAVVDLRDGIVRYSNGGHNPPRIVRDGGASVAVAPLTGDVALGVLPGHEFHEKSITLEPGDVLFLYTDGITEACNSIEEEFGEARLDRQLSQHGGTSMGILVDQVVKAVEGFSEGMEQFDDMTSLAIRWNAVSPTVEDSGIA